MIIRPPQTDQDFEAYFQLRWEVLRAPWGQPPGSEQDELEDSAFHLMAEDESGVLLGVGRLHWNSPVQAQIRYMAVAETFRKQGVGKQLLKALESAAVNSQTREIMLHARESVTGFYEANGYDMVAPSHLLFGEIQHFLMRKTFIN